MLETSCIKESSKNLLLQFLPRAEERGRCSIFQQYRYEVLLSRDAAVRAQGLVNRLGEA